MYGLLTTLLAGVYVGLAVGLGSAVDSKANSLVIAASTLVVAALFSPVRQRTQELIDRRFYRTRYDAARTLESFSARLRNETDLDTLSSDLVDVVRGTMRPAYVALWLKGGSLIATVPAAVTAPVTISER